MNGFHVKGKNGRFSAAVRTSNMKISRLRLADFVKRIAPKAYVAETNFAARKQKMFLTRVKNIFASRTQILRPKHMFPSLATPGNITRNIVSATMFPSLARPLNFLKSRNTRACSVVFRLIH